VGYPVSCPPLSAVYYSTYRFDSSCCILLLAIYSPSVLSSSHYGRAISQAISGRHHQERPVSVPGQFVWDLWWSKWHWGMFFSFSLSVTFHKFSLLIHSPTATLCNWQFTASLNTTLIPCFMSLYVISSSVTPCFSLGHFLWCTHLFVPECPLCVVILTPLFQNSVRYCTICQWRGCPTRRTWWRRWIRIADCVQRQWGVQWPPCWTCPNSDRPLSCC